MYLTSTCIASSTLFPYSANKRGALSSNLCTKVVRSGAILYFEQMRLNMFHLLYLCLKFTTNHKPFQRKRQSNESRVFHVNFPGTPRFINCCNLFRKKVPAFLWTWFEIDLSKVKFKFNTSWRNIFDLTRTGDKNPKDHIVLECMNVQCSLLMFLYFFLVLDNWKDVF